jgi:AcrR family transcriptional regulator
VSEARRALLDKAIRHAAEHGFAERSLRQIATDLGTSHRMLIYHFGSRDGLLTAIVGEIEQDLRRNLDELMARADLSPVDQGLQFWHRLTETTVAFGPLFFELAAAAMRGAPHASQVPHLAIRMWLKPLTALWLRAGATPERAPHLARLGLATANGLLLDLLLTGDRRRVDAAMTMFVEAVVARECKPNAVPAARGRSR